MVMEFCKSPSTWLFVQELVQRFVKWKTHKKHLAFFFFLGRGGGGANTDTEMWFWWNFRHLLFLKVLKRQLLMQPVTKMSSKWRRFRCSVTVTSRFPSQMTNGDVSWFDFIAVVIFPESPLAQTYTLINKMSLAIIADYVGGRWVRLCMKLID